MWVFVHLWGCSCSYLQVSDWGLPREWRVGASLSAGGGPCFRDLVYLSPEALTGTTPSVEADMYR